MAILLVLVENLAHALLEPQEADELRVGRIRDEVHLWRGRLGRRDLKHGLANDIDIDETVSWLK